VVEAHYKKDDLLNYWTSNSDISGYHTDFHEGHGTVGAWQARSMAWAWHAMCESAFKSQDESMTDQDVEAKTVFSSHCVYA